MGVILALKLEYSFIKLILDGDDAILLGVDIAEWCSLCRDGSLNCSSISIGLTDLDRMFRVSSMVL